MKNISNSMCSYKSGNARSVTILTCTGNYIAAKTHALGRDGRRETNAYRVGMHFDMRVVAFKDLPELFDILVRAAADSRQFVIRGSLMDDAPRNAAGHVRRTSRKQTDGEEPSFQDTDREWVMIDFDKVDNPNELDPISIEAMEHLRTLLPPAFRGVSCIYSLSASAGMTDSDMISGHLWFVLDKPVSNRELKVWLSGYPVDTALFNAVQPHYIAPPVFCDGLVDPVDERKGLLPGRCDVVAVPVIDISMPGYKHEGGAQGLEAAHGYEAKMALLGDGVGKDGCHAVITRAIASYITVHGPEADREALKADIRKRTAAAPWDRSKHTDEYVAREVSDQTLDRSIEDWIDKALVQREGYAVSKLDDVDTAREKVKNAVSKFVTDSTGWNSERIRRIARLKNSPFRRMGEQWALSLLPPPRHGLNAQVGLGKTEAYISQVPEMVRSLRKDNCVLVAVPNHRLSREVKERLAGHGVDAEVYLGPSQEDPEQPEKTMCWISDKLQVMYKAGAAAKLCKVCPHSQQCGFQK